MLGKKDPGASSLGIRKHEKDVILTTVSVARIDQVLNEHDMHNSSLLKVDVEGFELDVIEGALGILNKIDVIILECRFFKYFDEMYEFHEVVQRMSQLGYVVYDILDGGYRREDGVLDLVDLLFVRKDGSLRREIFKDSF